MNEAEAVEKTLETPATVQSLESDLRALGVTYGMTLLLHSSLSSLGWICGGPVAVILALENLLGPNGTLIMPTHSGDLSDPAEWGNPPVPEHWWKIIRQTMPAFDPDLTPTRKMGAIPECFRKQKDTQRSSHPQVSFTAWGARREYVTKDHSLEFSLGNDSPLGKIYELDGWVLLLGVNHEVNTSLHLAEYRTEYPGKRVVNCGAPLMQNNCREWKQFKDIDLDVTDFHSIGKDFAKDRESVVHRGYVASAKGELFPQRVLVDYAVEWMEKNRNTKR